MAEALPSPISPEVRAFRAGILHHLKAGFDAQRDLLRVRWELATWLRQFIPQGRGGDRRSDQSQRVGFDPRDVVEAMREAGEITIRWKTLRTYLPLGDFPLDEILVHAHTVRGALQWCREQNMTPKEREAMAGEQRRSRTLATRSDASLRATIIKLERKVAQLQLENRELRHQLSLPLTTAGGRAWR